MPNTTSSRTTDALLHRLSVLTSGPQRDALTTGLRGIEKESLRVISDGHLAMTPHPRALGSALTHPSLTTDYSEALLELITSAEHDAATTLFARVAILANEPSRVLPSRDGVFLKTRFRHAIGAET